MSADRNTTDLPADAPLPDAIDRAAAIDDFFGGFTPDLAASAAGLGADEVPLPGSLDLLLLLRQAGATTAPPAAAPTSIGRYRVVRLAGRGGFSVVWEAFDPLMRRRVAVKCCSPDALVSPNVRRRFRREAELASRLVHPHIVTIHEVGDDRGLDYITSEFCSGGSLAAWLGRHPGPVAPRVAARIARAVALAASRAHETGIIHRDIKPGNVMLVPVADRDADAAVIPPEAATDVAGVSPGMTVKLGDFGLGLQRDGTGEDDPLTQLTADGTRLGTPAWMAPEQIDRSFGDVGPATDVHAIGLLLDRMLTGRPLRDGTTDAETYRQIILDEPVAASRVERGVSPDLAAVSLRCLAKKPGDRYESAAALADDLGRWLAGRPTIARPLGPGRRLVRFLARRPAATALAAAALVASIAAVWLGRQYASSRALASAHEATLVQQRSAAELIRGYDAMRGGNVAAALDHLDRTATIDPGLAASFAGRWLARRTHGERDVLLTAAPAPGQPDDLHCVAVAPAGRVAAVGGADGRLWLIRDLDTTPAASAVEAHDEINDVCFSPDGGLVASVGQDGRLRWWRIDGATGGLEPAGAAPPAGAPLYAACFTADGTGILYGGEDRVLRRVSIADDAPPREGHAFAALDGFHQDIEAIALVSDTTAVVAYGPTLSIVDTEAGRMRRPLERGNVDIAPSVIHSIAVSPDRTRIVAGGSDRFVRLWDVATGAVTAALPAHPDWVQSVAFTPDGQGVVTACRDGVGRVFDAVTGAPRANLLGHRGRVWDVAFDGAGRPLTVGADGTLRRWDRSGDDRLVGWRLVPVTGGVAWGVAVADGSPARMLVLHHIGPVTLLTPGAASEVASTNLDVGVGQAIAFDPSGRRVAIGFAALAGRQAPLVAELGENGRLAAVAGPADCGHVLERFVTWTPDGRLVGCTAEGRMFAWSPALDAVTEIGRVPVTLNPAAPARVVAAAPTLPPRVAACGDAAFIVTISPDGRPAGSPTRLRLPGSAVSAVGWSPDGLCVVCGMRDGGVHVFDAATGGLVGSLMPHVRYVQDLTFTPDGRTLITADTEHLRISDVATLQTLDEMAPSWSIHALGASPDGTRVVVTGMGSLGLPADRRAKLAILELDTP